MGDPIPDFTDEQYGALCEYINGHKKDETYSLNPLNLSRILAGDKRGAYINAIRE